MNAYTKGIRNGSYLPEIIIEEKLNDPNVLAFQEKIPSLLEELTQEVRRSIEKIVFRRNSPIMRLHGTYIETKVAGRAEDRTIIFWYPTEKGFFHEAAHVYFNYIEKQYQEKKEKSIDKELQDLFARFQEFLKPLNIQPNSQTTLEEGTWKDFKIRDDGLVANFSYQKLPGIVMDGSEWMEAKKKIDKFLEMELPKTYSIIKDKIPRNFAQEWKKIFEEKIGDEELDQLMKEGKKISSFSYKSFKFFRKARVSLYKGGELLGELSDLCSINDSEIKEDVATFFEHYYRMPESKYSFTMKYLDVPLAELINPESNFYQRFKNINMDEIFKRKPWILEQVASKYRRKLELLREFGFLPEKF